MMRYAQIIPNDVSNGEGVCVSFFVQGCPHRCPGCFNPETWSFLGGKEYTQQTKWDIVKAISDNNIQRNFCVLGGEPMALNNLPMTDEVVSTVRAAFPNIKIYLWTGFTFDELQRLNQSHIQHILSLIDILIDGRFIEDEKDLSLKWRGSRNQNIWIRDEDKWEKYDESETNYN